MARSTTKDESSRLKAALTVRGDSVYCPLSFSLDSYWNCFTDCHHCYFRHLNRTWGTDLRPADPDATRRQLLRGLKNRDPKTPVAHCIRNRKTIRLGNKTDPFQEAELMWGISRRHMEMLNELDWTYVIQTRFTGHLMLCNSVVMEAARKELVTVMPVISPGFEADWGLFERKRTTPPIDRLKHIRMWKARGVPIGVNGEPFIPGHHTVDQFEQMLRLLKEYGVPSYNVYNLHFNEYVAKRLHAIGVDIEKVWHMNQDKQWRPILRKLLDLGKAYDIRIGCPDFVNSGKGYREPANTCCGIQVPNPTTLNAHHFKRHLQKGRDREDILEHCDDGSAKLEDARAVLFGTRSGFYTMKDAGFED